MEPHHQHVGAREFAVDVRIWVDPAASRHVWVAGVPLLESPDAGATWHRGSSFHADQHAMAWDARSAGRVYLGDDGGVYRSQSNGSVTGTWTKATSLPVNQFYTVAVSRQDPSRVSGGAQDNGSLRSWGTPSWNAIGGGDGTTNLIDPTNQNRVYSCSQFGACSRSTDGGNSSAGFGATVSDRRNWLTPIAFDPSNPTVMYYGGNRLNRSTDAAASWTVISPDLTHGSGGVGGAVFGTITTVAVAPSDTRVVYAGTDDGRAWVTRDTGGTWTEITAGLPTRWITHVTVDPADSRVAYLSVSGYRNGDPKAHVFRTVSGGSAWQDISGNLPDAPVNDLVLDPRLDGHGCDLVPGRDGPARRTGRRCGGHRRGQHHPADGRDVRPGHVPGDGVGLRVAGAGRRAAGPGASAHFEDQPDQFVRGDLRPDADGRRLRHP